MANTFADGTRSEHWIPNVQDELDKRLVALAISTVSTKNDRVFHNPYNSTPSGADGTATTAYSVEDFTSTDDTLTVSRRAVASEHVDSIEELQTNYNLAMQRSTRHAYVVRDKIDQYVLNLPVSLSGVADIDDGDFGGTDGNAKVTSSTNIEDVANTIMEKVALNNGALDRGMFWVVSPFEVTDMASYMQNNGFNVADAAIKNGFVGSPFAGLDIFVSNNLTHSVVLTMDTNPTAGDTMTLTIPSDAGVASITLTFVATLTPLAGEIHITSTVDITRANVAEFLTAYGADTETEATDTGYVALSAANIAALKRAQLVATNNNTTDTLTITTKTTLQVAETFTASTNVFGTVSRHTIAGVKGSIFTALPRGGMEFEKKAVTLKHGREIVTSQVYNATVWQNDKGEVFDVIVG